MIFQSTRLRIPQFSRGLASIRDVVDQSPQRVAVLFGTYSGNTERYANYLVAELKWRLGVDAILKSISTIDFKDLSSLKHDDCLLMLTSTYGDGEPNDATLPLWNQLIQQRKSKEPLRNLFSVMSRGSSLYENTFAQAGIMVDTQFAELGAERFAPLGIQDKISLAVEDEYFNWKEGVVAAFKDKFHLKESPFVYHPVSTAVELERTNDSKVTPVHHRLPLNAKLTTMKVHTLQQTDRQYVECALDIGDYEAGDYALIWPSNTDYHVNLFLSAIFGNSPRKHNLVKLQNDITSYELLARNFVDIQGQPERELLLYLAHLAPSQKSADAVREFLESGRPMPGLAQVLSELGCGTPWIESLPMPSTLFDLFPPLEPRRYSVSSAPIESPNQAKFTAVVEHEPLTDFWGVATGQMADIAKGFPRKVMAAHEEVPDFQLPQTKDVPLLCFGVGTGVAAFRGLILQHLEENKRCGAKSRVVLFTGTRTPEDLTYTEELHNLSNSQEIDLRIIPAYSRSTMSPYKYIAQSIAQNGDLIYDLLQQDAHIYICGDVRKVRRSVRNGITQILADKKDGTLEKGRAEWKFLKAGGRIHIELW